MFSLIKEYIVHLVWLNRFDLILRWIRKSIKTGTYFKKSSGVIIPGVSYKTTWVSSTLHMAKVFLNVVCTFLETVHTYLSKKYCIQNFKVKIITDVPYSSMKF